MLQINDFWSNLSAEVLNFSGMSADMFAALLYAVVSIGNLHQGPNLFAVLAPFLMKWASLYINKKNCQLFFILSLSPEARYKFEVSQGRAFDLSAFKLWLCQSICHASSQVQVFKNRNYRIKGFTTILQGLLKQHILQIADRNQWGATVLHWQACSGLTMHSMHEPMQTLTRPKVSSIKGSVVGYCHLWGYV